MDSFTLGIFRKEVALQCKALLSANESLGAAASDDDIWIALQNLLIAGANLSKLLWGGRSAGADREVLRRGLVEADSPLRSRDLRNYFEHWDEKLVTDLARQGERMVSIYVGRNVGQGRAIPQSVDGKSREFQHFNPITGEVSFWEHSQSVPALTAEAARILKELGVEIPPSAGRYRSPRKEGTEGTHVQVNLEIRVPRQSQSDS